MATIVWVVAIEHYGPPGAVDELTFPVPIGDYAFDLIQRVIAQSPETRIVFNQSLPDSQANLDRLQGLRNAGVDIGGASSHDLREGIGKLRYSDSLVIYWIGHGLMVNNRRLVLSAESRAAGDLVTIEVDSILTRLRSADYARMQIGFFDVCAHLYPTPPTTFDLGGDGGVAKDQFFYFSAAAAETAAINPDEPGFSSTVIDALSNPANQFPPEPVALFDELRKRFFQLKLASRAFPLQRTEHSGSEWTLDGVSYGREIEKYAAAADCDVALFDHLRQQVGGAITLDKLSAAVRDGRVDELVQRLRDNSADQHVPNLLQDAWHRMQVAERLERTCLRVRLTWSAWLSLYNGIVASDRLNDGSAPDNLVHMFIKVLSQPRDRGRESLIRLLELASRRVRLFDIVRADELLTVVRRDPALGHLYAQAVQALPITPGPIFLLLGIGFTEINGPPCILESWAYVNGEEDGSWKHACTEIGLPRQVNALVERAKSIYVDRKLVVELLTPSELLCSPKELLEMANSRLPIKTWLEGNSAFTLRWHDRMKLSHEFSPGTWKQQAAAAKHRISQSQALNCTWTDEGQASHVVGIPFPGPSLEMPQRNGEAFFKILVAGEPYMCWPRNERADLANFKQTVSFFVNSHAARESRFASLAEALKAAKAAGDPMLVDLWLFVDEPERNPYETRYVEASEQGIP